jgi:hypothetical protein
MGSCVAVLDRFGSRARQHFFFPNWTRLGALSLMIIIPSSLFDFMGKWLVCIPKIMFNTLFLRRA